MINKELINHILSNSGQLRDKETWYDVGEKFHVTAPDESKAKIDHTYKKKAVARKAQQIWQRYIGQKNDLKLDRETYVNGKLKFETFKKKPDSAEMDFEGYSLERVTTNPYGGMWMKYKKDGPTPDSFKEILEAGNIEAWNIDRNIIKGES